MNKNNMNKSSSGNSNPIFVLFSGHNDRAIIALCRFFSMKEIDFCIICSSGKDLIFKTTWANKILFSRIDLNIDIDIFRIVSESLRENYGDLFYPVYCPTTEFINQFVLNNKKTISKLGWTINLPDADVYSSLTNKFLSKEIIKKIIEIKIPDELSWDNLKTPCVLKPISNIFDGKINYPLLCRSKEDLIIALKEINPINWFSQKIIDGQSYYLCAYLTRDGQSTHFWQQNLLQQPSGKSMLLARSVINPGIDLSFLFEKLHEMGYYGPFMMEVIQDEKDDFYYIEINPRFWGPLQLALDACPDILNLFVNDSIGENKFKINENFEENTIEHWYSWKFGAEKNDLKKYPALINLERKKPIQDFLEEFDVYAKRDTILLHGKY